MTRVPLCGFLLSAFALATTLGQDAAPTAVKVDKLAIAQLIDDTVASAIKGVESTALKSSLETIQQLADSYLNERGATVNSQDIVTAVGKITSKTNWQLTLSALLEDPLVQEERKVTAGLFVLNGLSLRLKTVDDDTLLNTFVAAASFTAKSVGRSLTIGETLYNYKEENVDNPEKRWTVAGDDDYRPVNRYYSKDRYNVRRSIERRKRWNVAVGGAVSYDFGNGYKGNYAGSYTF